MTCIVGLIDGEQVIIGTDSVGASGHDVEIRKDSKVFKVRGFVIGYTSSFRMIQLLRYSFIPPFINEKGLYEYMCTDFINAVRQCFKDGGFLQSYSDGDKKGGCFLVGYKNRLFTIHSDFQVGEVYCGFDSIGCGSSYAIESLCTTDNGSLPNEERVEIALEVASKRSAGVEPPFKILST